jgi:hypothetical protein
MINNKGVLKMNYPILLVLGALINLIAGTMLIVVFNNNFGFLGLISSSIFMGVLFINEVVKNLK